MGSEEGQMLLIPIRGSDEMVEVRLEDLSEDPSDIIDILKAELAPLELWLQLAVCTPILLQD
jgi:RNA polymerase-associated protein CTR9